MPALIENATLHVAAKAFREPEIRNVLLCGPKGVGKTTFGFAMADYLKLPAWKWQLHAESTPAEGFGMFAPGGENRFVWVPGAIDLAYHTPGVLILDELVEASGPVKTALYGALDEGRGGVMTYLDRTFTPGDKYKVIATMNGLPEDGGLPEPLLDRFNAVFLITYPSEQQLATLDADLRELCEDAYATANDPKSGIDPMMGPDLSFRTFKNFQALRRIIPLEQAALAACRGNQKLAYTFLEVLALADPVVEPAVTVAPDPSMAVDPAIVERQAIIERTAKRRAARARTTTVKGS